MPTKAELATKDPEILLTRIHKEFPDLLWNNYDFIDSGWDHEVLILDKKLVFRFPNSKEYLELLQNEVNILKSLQPQVTINIPNYSYVAKDYSFAGYPLIPGEELTKDYFHSLTPSAQNDLAKQLAGFLSTLHKITGPALRPFPMVYDDIPKQQERLKKQTEQYLKSKLSQEDFSRTQDILADIDKIVGTNTPIVFVHGDISTRHLLWGKQTNKLGVIDFSDMSKGDPAFDFAELYDYGKPFVEEVYRIYIGPKDDTFLDRATAYRRRVGVYLMVDSFLSNKISFDKAKRIFDQT